eukprot:9446505-Alexandrium_andersonii.AAC.1
MRLRRGRQQKQTAAAGSHQTRYARANRQARAHRRGRQHTVLTRATAEGSRGPTKAHQINRWAWPERCVAFRMRSARRWRKEWSTASD